METFIGIIREYDALLLLSAIMFVIALEYIFRKSTVEMVSRITARLSLTKEEVDLLLSRSNDRGINISNGLFTGAALIGAPLFWLSLLWQLTVYGDGPEKVLLALGTCALGVAGVTKSIQYIFRARTELKLTSLRKLEKYRNREEWQRGWTKKENAPYSIDAFFLRLFGVLFIVPSAFLFLYITTLFKP